MSARRLTPLSVLRRQVWDAHQLVIGGELNEDQREAVRQAYSNWTIKATVVSVFARAKNREELANPDLEDYPDMFRTVADSFLTAELAVERALVGRQIRSLGVLALSSPFLLALSLTNFATSSSPWAEAGAAGGVTAAVLMPVQWLYAEVRLRLTWSRHASRVKAAYQQRASAWDATEERVADALATQTEKADEDDASDS